MPAPSNPIHPEKFFTIKEAAPYLHLHPESLRRICRSKRINFGTNGRSILFTQDQLDAFVFSTGSAPLRKKYARLRKSRA